MKPSEILRNYLYSWLSPTPYQIMTVGYHIVTVQHITDGTEVIGRNFLCVTVWFMIWPWSWTWLPELVLFRCSVYTWRPDVSHQDGNIRIPCIFSPINSSNLRPHDWDQLWRILRQGIFRISSPLKAMTASLIAQQVFRTVLDSLISLTVGGYQDFLSSRMYM